MKFLRLPEIDQYDLDDPKRTTLHRDIILSKPFLKNLYLEWYKLFVNECSSFKDPNVIELGSGGGFLKDVYPAVKTSDILELDSNDLTFNALEMPFENNSVDCFLMIDVFHHVPDSKQFLSEMHRTLKPGGKIVMIEPWNSLWGRLIYKNFHHETFNPKGTWQIPSSGPMSDANGALPWIVFKRDLQKFKSEFPDFEIKMVKPHTPLRYLLSGGVSMKALVPQSSFKLFTGLERMLSPFSTWFSMFVYIVIEKKK